MFFNNIACCDTHSTVVVTKMHCNLTFFLQILRGGMVENELQYELIYNALYHFWTTRTGSDDDTRDIALEAIFDE